jgi:hypothetical protein
VARLGSYEWARTTGGSLTKAERRRLFGVIARSYHRLFVDRVSLAIGRVPDGARDYDAEELAPPDSKVCREAEAACAEQPQSVIGHAYRTWMYGSALARLDREELDPELFYVASLLHDAGVASPVPGQDFTIRSAEAALGAAERGGLDPSRGAQIADGICGHITPGPSIGTDGELAVYIQNGAMADLAGLRAWELGPAVRERGEREYPTAGTGRKVGRMWRAEAKAVPEGRAALLENRAGFSLALRFGPIR